ncbi:MAG: HRDC domain-containing protein [Anaerolineales bacterium]|nr:HRDC domain-containing protein [Anaerolineales bacterium]
MFNAQAGRPVGDTIGALKYSVRPYHAGLDDATRRNNQRAFVRDETAIMVATVAFGMGINKPNVRFVVHYNLPASIEQYYQEIGRAGRDGLSADCLLLYAAQDVQVLHWSIDEGAPEERPGRAARLQAMQRFAQATTCRRRQLLAYFGEEYEAEQCGNCDLCTRGAEIAAKSDVTESAQRFLEAVKQSRQRFGISHVVDILRGSQSVRIQKFQHQNLPIHGQGKDLSAKQWRSLAQALIQQGFATQDMEHGTLSITASGNAVLKGETQVWAEIESERPSGEGATPGQYDVELFTQLRKLRRTLADDANVPPYMIFSDVTLIAMASFRPRTPRELLTLNGVGERKLAQYGAAFLEVVNAYCAEHALPAFERPPLAPAKPKVSPRAQEMGRLYATGCTIAALMETYGLQHSTVLNHLADYVRGGGVLDRERLIEESTLTDEQRSEVFRAFATVGHERLTPVREHLEGRVEYNELHLLRMVWLLMPEDQRKTLTFSELEELRAAGPGRGRGGGIYGH